MARAIAVVAVLLVGLLVVACGDDDGPDNDATQTPELTQTDTPRPPTNTPMPTDTPNNCHPSYQGACLAQGVGDWDCTRAGGGDGPNYVEDVTSGSVQVVGPDKYELDRDNDGIGCE
ncbi:MAG: hypothetical protein IH859_02480 [Chloroflexi bacterium]|nr:hypothetical protein [Chloroflexota bacterium]